MADFLNSFQGVGGAAPTVSAQTQAKLRSLQGLAPPDDYTGPQWTGNGVTWQRDQVTGQWMNPTSDDPAIQKLIDSGAVTFDSGKVSVDQAKLQAGMPATKFGGFGSFSSPDVTMVNGVPTIKSGGNVRVGNATNVTWDPNYGWITPNQNIQNKDDWYDVLSGTVLPAAIAAGFTAGAGAIGAGVPWYASAGMKALQGGLSSPLSILSSLAPGLNDLGVPPGLTSAAQLGLTGAGVVNALQSQKQYSPAVSGVTPSAQATSAPTPAIPASNVAGTVPTSPTTPAAATNAAAPTVQYLPDPESGIPDQFNAAAFGGGGSAQVITDQSNAPVSTSVAPDAYSNSYSQIVS